MGSDAISIRHAEQYAGPWAMEPNRFRMLASWLSRIDLASHVRSDGAKARAEANARPMVNKSNRVAVLELRGVMTKYGSSLSDAPATLALTRTIRELTASGTCGGIVMLIDSPGGSAFGVHDLYSALRSAGAAGISTVAFVEDQAASAGYYAACGCDTIVCNAGGEVGSIGTMMGFEDVTEMYAKAGIRTELFTSSELKGAGTPGTSLSDAQRDEMQRYVDGHAELFTRAVAEGRGVDAATAQAWSDAAMHRAEAALAMGLIDQIGTIEDAIALASAPRSDTSQTRARNSGELRYQEKTTMKINADNGAIAETDAMSDSELRAWLAANRPAVLAEEAEKTDLNAENAEIAEEEKTAESGSEVEADTEQVSEQVKPDPAPNTASDSASSAHSALNSVPATAKQLRELGCSAEFSLGALEAGLTLDQAAALKAFGAPGATAKAAPAPTNTAIGMTGSTAQGNNDRAAWAGIDLPSGREATSAAAWSAIYRDHEGVRTACAKAGFRQASSFGRFAAGEAASGKDIPEAIAALGKRAQ
jgi:protease IV